MNKVGVVTKVIFIHKKVVSGSSEHVPLADKLELNCTNGKFKSVLNRMKANKQFANL